MPRVKGLLSGLVLRDVPALCSGRRVLPSVLRLGWIRAGTVIVGALALCAAGCAAQAAETSVSASPSLTELSHARAESAALRAQVAQLEARLAEVEKNVAKRRGSALDEQALDAKLDRLLALNQAALHHASSSECSRPVPQAGDAADPSLARQMKQLEERLRSFSLGTQGGLSREQREAMRLLLRQDRVLDESDPWSGY